MLVEASITGLFRTLLIIIGAFVLVRFIGQLMNAKRNMEEERQLNERDRKLKEEKRYKETNSGKTRILGNNKSSSDAEDVDFEEVE